MTTPPFDAQPLDDGSADNVARDGRIRSLRRIYPLRLLAEDLLHQGDELGAQSRRHCSPPLNQTRIGKDLDKRGPPDFPAIGFQHSPAWRVVLSRSRRRP